MLNLLSQVSLPEIEFLQTKLYLFRIMSFLLPGPHPSPLSTSPANTPPFQKKKEREKETVEWMIWELKTSKWGSYTLETAASITTFSLLSNIVVCWADSAPYLNLAAVP